LDRINLKIRPFRRRWILVQISRKMNICCNYWFAGSVVNLVNL
jgi:hypothetical protein